MNYTNREVVRRLKQYDMFLNSLNLTVDSFQKERICDQLDKIEKQILLETNKEYEEQYMLLLGEETKFFADEKDKLRKLISLIKERRNYLEERKQKHKDITGSLVELTTFLGEDKLTVFKRRLQIIEKYEENKVKQENLIKEMKSLDIKISEASRNVKANARLNDTLENKMKKLIEKALDKLDLYDLIDKKDDIRKKYDSLNYAVNLANENLSVAKKLNNDEMIFECDNVLSEITIEYLKYKEEKNIIKLIDIFDKPVSGYSELLEKREKIDDILKNIVDSKLYLEISDELNKQYTSIKLQKQDSKNYETLKKERDKKHNTLYEIEEENNSKEFKQVLDEIIKNENRYREEQIKKAKREEYQERQKKLLEEQKIEASRVRRQKLIEQARLKEQEERLKKVKELQDKTVINSQKEESLKDLNNSVDIKKIDENIKISDSFDTNELFEKTKIIPNKKEIKLDIEEKNDISVMEEIQNKEILEKDNNIDIPMWNEPVNDISFSENTIDLFKDESTIERVNVELNENKIDAEKSKMNSESIYDILENNDNIIWKTTDTNSSNNIPIINNNNLKPEIIKDEKKGMAFPKLDNKEGDILWKETL